MNSKLNYLKSLVGGIVTNDIYGTRLKDKLVIFESDDWGAIRTPNKEFVKASHEFGQEIRKSRYAVDSLASQSDLEDLFEVLLKHKDRDNNPARFTANSIMANPDFRKIRESSFKQYHYERFTETFLRYPQHVNNLEVWKKGMEEGVFMPQFHGREHLNISKWMNALQKNDKNTLFSFNHNTTYSGKADYSYMEAFEWQKIEEIESHKKILKDGLDIFKDVFGFQSTSFIAPCYTWDFALEDVLIDNGIKVIQGGKNQVAQNKNGELINLKHSFMERSASGAYYNIRNCVFEPSINQNLDWVDKVLARMKVSFLLGKPAVINTHRINFVGFIEEENKVQSLRKLDELLERMIKVWPDIKFASSDQLISYI